jgi:hypothetical protein
MIVRQCSNITILPEVLSIDTTRGTNPNLVLIDNLTRETFFNQNLNDKPTICQDRVIGVALTIGRSVAGDTSIELCGANLSLKFSPMTQKRLLSHVVFPVSRMTLPHFQPRQHSQDKQII